MFEGMILERLLIVEDDKTLLDGLSYILQESQYSVVTAKSVGEARRMFRGEMYPRQQIDLIVLDCNLPDGSGYDFCQEIKKDYRCKVLILTARNTEVDEIKAFKVGADDYISKPFSTAVLIERIKNLLKRSVPCYLVSNGVEIDLTGGRAYLDHEEIELTAIEYKMLCYFIENKNKLLTKDMIVEAVWEDGESADDNVIFQLDLILAGKAQKVSPYLNSRHSAIASRLTHLQQKMDDEVEKERISKEKVQTFISDLSHEIKTPLTNIKMYHEILVRKTELCEDLREKQERITEQIKKLEWILGSIFKSVYLEEEYLDFDMEYSKITDTIALAVSSVYKKAEDKGITISLKEFDDISVLHDKKWTAEALVNLLENSIKYSPANSGIQIHVRHRGLFSEIAVIDEGIGIDREEYPFIFRRFYRSKEVRDMEGSGIGLYLVKMIIEKEKGYVVVKSEKNSGTTFSVFLQNMSGQDAILTES